MLNHKFKIEKILMRRNSNPEVRESESKSKSESKSDSESESKGPTRKIKVDFEIQIQNKIRPSPIQNPEIRSERLDPGSGIRKAEVQSLKLRLNPRTEI